jgi:monoamine oxidase
MNEKTDILIVGAGICGLYAGRALSLSGKKVIILEANEKVGGRIRNISENFSEPIDAGAEFIHGNMQLTKSLLKEAGGKTNEKKGKFYQLKEGKISEQDHFTEGWGKVMKKLKSLEKDIPLSQFLAENFGEEKDRELRKSVIGLAEGFDAADADRISSFAVREEWSGDSIDDSVQIKEGYTLLINKLYGECRKNGCVIYLKMEVNEINWQPGKVIVKYGNGKIIESSKVLITVSLGILTSVQSESGHILFIPPIPEKIEAAKMIGFGPVIKIIFEFNSDFWNNKEFKDQATQIPDLSFLSTQNEIPVWWTKSPGSRFLTGWVGGSKAEKLKHLSEKELLEKAINALAISFHTTIDFLKEQLFHYSISNWGAEPFTKGAYSYETPETAEAKKIISEPIQETVYFAGEALGNHLGTVESALESAKEVAKKML